MIEVREQFSDNQIKIAIKQFLDYGEESFNPDMNPKNDNGHGGYYSGGGWAARCLRYHLNKMENKMNKRELT